MPYSVVTHLLIIFGLINYSYEFYAVNKFGNRYVRQTSVKQNTEAVLEDIFSDQEALETKMEELTNKIKRDARKISESIMAAADQMAEAGSKDIESVRRWTEIQNRLRQGINLIIKSYREFIKLHRQVYDAIDDFANNIIVKYEDELSSIDLMTMPDFSNSTSSARSDFVDWPRFMARFSQILNYARAHQETLGTATDCTGDLIHRTLAHRASVLTQPRVISQPMQIRIVHPANLQYDSQTFALPCNQVNQNNGYRSCSNAIADATTRYAKLVIA